MFDVLMFCAVFVSCKVVLNDDVQSEGYKLTWPTILWTNTIGQWWFNEWMHLVILINMFSMVKTVTSILKFMWMDNVKKSFSVTVWFTATLWSHLEQMCYVNDYCTLWPPTILKHAFTTFLWRKLLSTQSNWEMWNPTVAQSCLMLMCVMILIYVPTPQ